MRWVTAEDLKDWASSNDAKAFAPHLVRRLIEATATTIRTLEFPVAESTHRPGFDGVADLRSSDAEFLPDGVSVWEVSAETNVPGKAVDDFNERSEGPLPETLPDDATRTETTYVGVNIRPWPKRGVRKPRVKSASAKPKKVVIRAGILDVASVGTREDFVVKAKKPGIWRGVLMLDAHKLERWLEQRPAVGAWTARLIRKHSGLVRDFEGEWDHLRLQSVPVPWSTGMLLAGRVTQSQDVLKKLLEPGSVTSILADSVDEGIAFAIATVLALPEQHPDRRRIAASALVVGDATEANDLLSYQPLILILRDQAAKAARVLASKGHTCVVAIGRAQLKSGGAIIQLPRAPRDVFVQALHKDSYSWEDAVKYARSCSGSPTVLRRRVGNNADQPHWADPQSLSELAPVALLGMFDVDVEGDRECLAELSGKSVKTYIDVLQKHRGQGVDPPILMVQSQWSAHAPADILTVAFEHQIIGRALLERFASVALKVLSERDDALALSPDDRPFASMHGIKRRYSGALRNGISESLRLLAANPDALQREFGGSGQSWIDNLVARCPGISDDPYALLSMGSMLSAVAEAAPATFLDALEALLRGQREAMQGILFADSDDVLSSGSLFVSFTSALETIAWDPDWTNRVLDLLLTLSEMDPGGRISNRPIASLTEFFLPWAPATNAPVARRVTQLDRVLEAASYRVAWDLISRLLPGATLSAIHYCTPLWRSFDIGQQMTYADLFAASSGVVGHAIRMAESDIVRWRALVAALTSSGPDDLDTILTALERLDVRSVSREPFWQLLRQEVARNDRFADTQWALKGTALNRLRAVAQRFVPSDLEARNRWLFDDGWPDIELIEADGGDDEIARLRLRTAAIKEIVDAGGQSAVLDFARHVKMPGMLVDPLTMLLPPAGVTALVVEAMQTFDEVYFPSCLSAAGQARFGVAWGEGLLSATSALPSDRRAALVRLWRNDAEAIQAAQAMGPDVEKAYWATRPEWIANENPDLQQSIVRGLLDAARGIDIAPFVSAHRKILPTSLLLDTVKSAHAELTANPSASNVGNLAYHLVEIIRTLAGRDDAPEDDIVKFEFLFLNQIVGHGRGKAKLAIHRAMARAPSLFIDVIKTIFRGDDEPKPTLPVSEDARAYATQCYRLLGSFSLSKGSSAEAILLNKPGVLEDWVTQVRSLAAESGRLVITDLQLGKLFATSMEDPSDGLRPHRAVRDVIEKLPSEEISRGFSNEVFNLRGVHGRGLDEGGEQEHALADQWLSIVDKLSQWPHTAAIARIVSAMWRAHADEEDVRREKRRARGE